MVRKTSPINKVIKPDNQSENQHGISSRQKAATGISKHKNGTVNDSHFSGIELQSIKEQLAQREAELAVINSIQAALASKMDFQGIIDAVGDKVGEIFEDGNVGIGFVDDTRNVVTFPYVVENGKRIHYFEIGLDVPSVLIHTIKRRRPLVINKNISRRFGTEVFNFPGQDQHDLKAWLSVPLISGDKFLGGIALRNWERENAYTDSDVRLLQTIANSMSVAIENVRLFNETQRLLEETEQRATELQIINNIGQTLTEGLDLQNTLERVGERLRMALRVDNFGITAYDVKTGLAISHYVYLKGKRVIPDDIALRKYRLGMRFASKMAGKPLVVNANGEKYWDKIGVPGYETPKSFVMFPLLAGRELVGNITIVDFERENAFTNLPMGMLETIASNMGTAIQNVRLFNETQRLLQETEQRATELQIINNIGQILTEGGGLNITIQRVGERIQKVLDVSDIVISVFDEKTSHVLSPYMVRNGKEIEITEENIDLKRFKLGIRASARAGGRSWVVNKVAEKSWRKWWISMVDNEVPKSFVTLPLLAGREVIGGITIADYEKENAFSDLSVGLLETIASNMGTAVQNVRLFDETQRLLKQTEQRATELQIINNIGQTLTQELDLHTLIERVGDELRESLNVENIGIGIYDQKNNLMEAPYIYRAGKRLKVEPFALNALNLRVSKSGKTLVVNTNADRHWQKLGAISAGGESPKSFVMVPLMAGKEMVGGLTIQDFENENTFSDLSVSLLEAVASNMGTAIQNARLFEETERLFQEAREARAAAEQANKAKSTFLANMSHELRTPLNAIMGFTRIVRKKGDGLLPEKQIENLDKVLSSSEHLLGLINTVLDIAKIEAGRMDVIPAYFHLSILADQCAYLATPLLKPNVELNREVDETIGSLFSDQDKIKQIVLNLLSNAAKFTQAGSILLRVEKINEENVSISVSDSGIGISEEALGRVFEEFQQADSTTTRQYGGTGLGLAISRNLARLLGGDLTATSELGRGSTFALTLPIQYRSKAILSSDLQPASTRQPESHVQETL